MAKGVQAATAVAKKPDPAPAKTTAVATAEKKSTAVAPADDLLAMMAGDAGRGVSTAAADNIVPLLKILQSNSPSLDRSEPTKFLKGAKAGDLWLRGTTTFVDADMDNEGSGLIGIPCHFSKSWLKWKPNRGGLVGRHKDRPPEAVEKTEIREGKERRAWKLPNDNTVVETREHVFLIVDEKVNGGKPTPVVVPMTSTDHTSSREWMGLMNGVQLPGTEKTPPSFGVFYRLYTIPKKNDLGSWYGFRACHAGEDGGSQVPLFVSDIKLYSLAKKINSDFTSGALVADQDDDVADREAKDVVDSDM